MTDEMMALRGLMEKSADADLLREMIVRRQHSEDSLRVFTNGGWLVHRSPQERR